MELTFACSQCQTVSRQAGVERASAVACSNCSVSTPIHASSFDGDGLVACPLCATEDLYTQKDFPQILGVTIVVVGFIISSIFWYYERPLVTYGILLTSALMDMVLFYRVPNVTICYRCLSQIRGDRSNPGGRFHAFDLGVGERYRQERIRIQEIRDRAAAASASNETRN